MHSLLKSVKSKFSIHIVDKVWLKQTVLEAPLEYQELAQACAIKATPMTPIKNDALSWDTLRHKGYTQIARGVSETGMARDSEEGFKNIGVVQILPN